MRIWIWFQFSASENMPRGDSSQLGRALLMKNAGGQGISQIFIKMTSAY